MSTLANRFIGSVRLRAESYEEIEADRKANWQAVTVVLLSSLAAAIGTGMTNVLGLTILLLFALATWISWVLLALVIGTEVLPGRETKVDFGQLFRTTGFSAAPGIFRALGFFPTVGWLIFLGATIWMLFSFVVAIRQALDFTNTQRAVAVCLLGWLIHGMLFFGFLMTAY